MSRSYEAEYALQREMRRRIAAARVSNTTEQFYRRYMDQYEELQRKGAASYIPDEMARLGSDLSQIRDLLISDPFEAREISRGVGSYIHSLHGMARAAEQQFEQAARLQAEARCEDEKQQKNSALNEYYRQVRAIAPSIVHFGMDRLQALREEIEHGNLTDSNQIHARISEISSQAEQQASEWKKNAQERVKIESAEKRLQEAEEQIRCEKWEDSQTAQKFTEQIARLREDLAAGKTTADDVSSAVEQMEVSAEEEKITEDVRRQTVIGIMKQLQAQEFVVSKPQLVDNGGETYVKITAQQPSGRRAACRIDLNGKIQYRFDCYEGMTCLKDIQKFNVDLERIYSIKLSDERVLWENPDRLTRDENSSPAGNSERSHN